MVVNAQAGEASSEDDDLLLIERAEFVGDVLVAKQSSIIWHHWPPLCDAVLGFFNSPIQFKSSLVILKGSRFH